MNDSTDFPTQSVLVVRRNASQILAEACSQDSLVRVLILRDVLADVRADPVRVADKLHVHVGSPCHGEHGHVRVQPAVILRWTAVVHLKGVV